MAPALVTTTTVPAIVYATALFSDTQVDTRSHRDAGARAASMAAASAIAREIRDTRRIRKELRKQERDAPERVEDARYNVDLESKWDWQVNADSECTAQ